jgi:hypothetical protein
MGTEKGCSSLGSVLIADDNMGTEKGCSSLSSVMIADDNMGTDKWMFFIGKCPDC